MKKFRKFYRVFILALTISTLFSSCATILAPKQKQHMLVDVPNDLKIKNLETGEDLKLNDCIIFYESDNPYPGKGFASKQIQYFGKGFKMKVKKKTQLEFTTGGVSKSFIVGGKFEGPSLLYLFADLGLTAGVGLVVDLLTKAIMWPSPNFIDISSLMSGKEQRTSNELKEHIRKTYKPIVK